MNLTFLCRLNSREYMRQGTSSGKVLSASMTDPRMIPLSTLRVPTERCADRGATSNVIECKVDIDQPYVL
ncbi:hypothetical protein BD309DRAFT_436300 [Dichomitus squalens]|nr:hypothetical protein BD309DRAFT_436300 [Dichomitus squalens]